jgi:hypothetical protein
MRASRMALLVAAGVTAAGILAGCGGAERSATTATRPGTGPSPTLVAFKRWAGSDPAEDDVLVRRDHTADLHLIHGGAAGHFGTVRLSGSEWSALLATRPEKALAHPGPVVDRPIRGGYHYVVTVPGVTPVVGDNGVLPRRVQRVVGAMNRIVDNHAF